MASYFNPYLQQPGYQVAYNGGSVYQTAPVQPVVQQSYAPAQPPMQSNVIGVDGEIGAKAFNIPNGSTGPIALWDTNDNVIYMRTFNAAGMPMPLKKLRYTEEEPVIALPAQSGSGIDTSQFVTKNDFEQLRNEIRQLSQQHAQSLQSNQSYQSGAQGSQNNQGGGQRRQ